MSNKEEEKSEAIGKAAKMRRRREVFNKIVEGTAVDSADVKVTIGPDGKERKSRARREVFKGDADANKTSNTVTQNNQPKPMTESLRDRLRDVTLRILIGEADLSRIQKNAADKVKAANIQAKATLQADKIKDDARKKAKQSN